MNEEETAAQDAQQKAARSDHVRLLAKAVWRFRGTDVSALAAETAYFSILAIAPFLLFLIAGIAVISQFVPIGLVDDLEQTVSRMAPGDTGELLLPLVEEAVDRTDSGTLSFGMFSAMIVAMWSGSRAIATLMKGTARVSGAANEHPMIWRRIVALVLAVVLAAVSVLSVAVFLFGGSLGRAFAEAVRLGDTFASIWVYISWPLMAGIILLMISVFYWFASGWRWRGLRFISPGAVAATILWVMVMLGIRVFLWIVDPGSVYGALGSFIVLVVFFYIMSLAMLFGAAVNAEVRESRLEAS
jgi:membrane protein